MWGDCVKWILKYGNKKLEFDEIYYVTKKLYEKLPDTLTYENKGNEYKVDFSNGNFYINDKQIDHGIHLPDNPKLRFINFRRVRQIHDASTFELVRSYFEIFIGWQTTINGKNIKRMMRIHQDGTFEIVDRS